jgi:hypothetical protein
MLSLFRFTPMLQHFQIIDDSFLNIPTDQPVLEFLTVIECGSEAPNSTKWLQQLLKCTPMLKKIRCPNLGAGGYFNAPESKKTLRLVRNTIEEIEFDRNFEDYSETTGGIGPFKDFPKLKKISTEVESLVPQPGNLLKKFSLIDSLLPNLESLHLTDIRGFLTSFLPFGGQ